MDELVAHYQVLKKTQIAIVSKYTELDENGGIKFDSEGKAIFKSHEDEVKCQKEIAEIRNETIDIPLIDKVKIYDDDKITPRKLLLLQEVVEVVEREQPKAPVAPVPQK
jgi:hypothetical protein